MEKGFYSEPDVDEALENWFFSPNSDICGEMFLHGVCGIFALALHDIYGYELGWILDDEDQSEKANCIPWSLDNDTKTGGITDSDNPWNHLVHIFCHTKNDRGETIFVDIRGCQTDDRKFECPFEDFFVEPNYNFGLSYETVKKEIKSSMSTKSFEEFYKAAIYFIKNGGDIYTATPLV